MQKKNVNCGLMIPTFNAGKMFPEVLERINTQKGFDGIRKIIIDSGSSDNTVQIAKKLGFEVYSIEKSKFTHGLVRKMATEILSSSQFIFFMTQDVFLHDESLKNLLNFINRNETMAIAYGRQVAGPQSSYFDKKDRKYNYPKMSLVKSSQNISSLGIKTVFSSDAFSVYRRKSLMELGNFPESVSFAEDMYMAALAIVNNFQVGYCADAVVTHSNELNLVEQFKRYKNIGYFHAENKWIQDKFGSNETIGLKLVLEQLAELIHLGKWYLIGSLLIRNGVKYLGYEFGKSMKKRKKEREN